MDEPKTSSLFESLKLNTSQHMIADKSMSKMATRVIQLTYTFDDIKIDFLITDHMNWTISIEQKMFLAKIL